MFYIKKQRKHVVIRYGYKYWSFENGESLEPVLWNSEHLKNNSKLVTNDSKNWNTKNKFYQLSKPQVDRDSF